MQRDLGPRTATDGEFRRATGHLDSINAMAGISRVDVDTAEEVGG